MLTNPQAWARARSPAEDAGELAGRRAGRGLTRRQSTGPSGREGSSLSDPQPCDDRAHGAAPQGASVPQGSLLLVENASVTCVRLQRALAASGFALTRVSLRAALAAAYNAEFAYAVVEAQFRGRKELDLVRKLRRNHAGMRIVVITDYDSFATVILALRAGADDYLAMPVSESELIDALLGRRSALPPIPETPLGVQRIRWEYTQRILEQCGRNVAETARRLRMYRRSLHRMLDKRAPYSRGSLQL
jgi:two-component system, response regulator RegA